MLVWQKCIIFADKMNRNHSSRHVSILLLLLWLLTPHLASAYTDHRNAKVDSAEQVLSSGRTLTDRERMSCYYTIVRGTLGKDTKKHDLYAHKMLDLSYKIDAKNMRENALNHLGLQYYGQEDFEPAERYFLWAIAVTDSMRGDSRYSEQDIDDNYSQLYGALGNLYNLQDKALIAIEYYQKALPIFEKNGWLESQTILHHNVAELWLAMGNYAKAEQEYLKAIATGTKSGDSLMMALPRKGLVKIYLDQDNYTQALLTAGQAYDYYHAHRDDEHGDYAEVLASLTKIHLMDGHKNLTAARAYCAEALALDTDVLMFEVHADVQAAAAMLSIEEGRWQEALGHALSSVHQNDSDATYSDVGCYELLAHIYMQLGQKDEAARYIKKMRAMMERFATEHYQSGLSQMEVLYQTKEKEAEIEQLKRERQWYLWGGILTALVLLLAAVSFTLYIHSQRLKRKTDLVLAKLEGEQAERVRIARDLHDRLGGLLTAIKLHTPAEAPTVTLIDEAVSEMRNVSHHLLPDSLSRYGLEVALRDFCSTMKNVKFAFSGTTQHIAYEETLYCIVHELVNNAVKSSQADHILVSLIAAPDYTAVNVSDDGIGLQSTDDHQGMGMSNLRERVAAIGGRLDISSAPGRGTEINIELKNEKQ